jgi:hypothetical protein
MDEYYKKYLKYKTKYLELKNILRGGVDVDLTVLYANVGVDNVYNNYEKMPYCQQTGTQIRDYEHEQRDKSKTGFTSIDSIEISELTLNNLKNAIDNLIETKIDVLMFCEFCFSQLHQLIEYLNVKDSANRYDILLIGQKRDDTLYGVIDVLGVLKTEYNDIINGYHPDATTQYKDKSGVDGYFKCFGYIYKKDKLTFNNAETLRQNKMNNDSSDVYGVKIDKIDTLNEI